MLFNSWSFIVFFIIVMVLYYALAHRWRIYLILVASYFFYMSWRWEFGFLMLGVSISNFYAGTVDTRSPTDRRVMPPDDDQRVRVADVV